jgi:hypothetical protein
MGSKPAVRFDWSWVLDNPYDGLPVPVGVQREAFVDVMDVYCRHMQFALANNDTARIQRLMHREHKLLQAYVAHGFSVFEPALKDSADALYKVFRAWRRATIRKALTGPDADIAEIVRQLERFPNVGTVDFHADLDAANRKIADPTIDMMADIRLNRAG